MMNLLIRVGDLIAKWGLVLVVAILIIIGLAAWKIWGGAH